VYSGRYTVCVCQTLLFDYNLVTCLEGAVPPSQKEFAFFSSNDTETGLSTSNILSAGRTDAIQIGETILQECFGCLLNSFAKSTESLCGQQFSSLLYSTATYVLLFLLDCDFQLIFFRASSNSRNFSKLNLEGTLICATQHLGPITCHTTKLQIWDITAF